MGTAFGGTLFTPNGLGETKHPQNKSSADVFFCLSILANGRCALQTNAFMRSVSMVGILCIPPAQNGFYPFWRG